MAIGKQDRRGELEEFKKLNLSLIASQFGYEIDRRKSTRHSVLMVSSNDKIIITQNGQHYVYCSVYDSASSGTAIDFVQRVVEPHCSLGRVRQLLRPFLNSGYISGLLQNHSGKYATEIKPSKTDLAGVATRYAHFDPIDQPHPYLCVERAIPFELLQSRRLAGRIRHCPRRGSIVFPHWGASDGTRSDGVGDGERSLVGYEFKGPGLNMFSKGGRKGLWMSAGFCGDCRLVVAESGLDAVSYLVAHDVEGTRVASLSGRMNPQQPALVLSAIKRMEEGAEIVAAFDNDAAGDELTQKLEELVHRSGRADLLFLDDRPSIRGADWNQVIMERAKQFPQPPSLTPMFGQ